MVHKLTQRVDISFLKDKNFLKKNENLFVDYIGTKLDELIFLEHIFNGRDIDHQNIFQMSTDLSNEIKTKLTEKNSSIRNSRAYVFIYTTVEIEQIPFFFVYQFETKLENLKRSSWEKKYNLESRFCCKKNLEFLLFSHPEIIKNYISFNSSVPEKQVLSSLTKNLCCYPKNNVNVSSVFSCNLLVKKQILEKKLNLQYPYFQSPITDSTSLGNLHEIIFCYDTNFPEKVTCDKLYTKLDESNLNIFLFHCFNNIINFQKNIFSDNTLGERLKHTVLFLSFYV